MYGANTLCDGQCWRSRNGESAAPSRAAEVEWLFVRCTQFIADEGRNDVPPSDKLHYIVLACRPDAIPDENNITVQGILEKS